MIYKLCIVLLFPYFTYRIIPLSPQPSKKEKEYPMGVPFFCVDAKPSLYLSLHKHKEKRELQVFFSF